MADKYIVNLGGGVNQLPYIIAQKSAGYRVIVVDKNSSACGKCEADFFVPISLDRPSEIYRVIEDKCIAGVVSEETDAGSGTLAKLNDLLALPGLDQVTHEVISDKLKQREFFKSARIPQPQFHDAQSFQACERKDQLFIVKPRSGHSSIGVSIYQESMAIREDCIYEEFLDGEDYSVDGYIADQVVFTSFCKVFKYPGVFFGRGSVTCATIPGAVETLCLKILKALGVKWSLFHIEVKRKGDDYFHIETHLRGGGSGLASRISSFVSNENIPARRVRLLEQNAANIGNKSSWLDRLGLTVFGTRAELEKFFFRADKYVCGHELVELRRGAVGEIKDGRDRQAVLLLFGYRRYFEELSELSLSAFGWDLACRN